MSDTTDTEPTYLWADMGVPKVRHILSTSRWSVGLPGTGGYGLCGQYGETVERARRSGRTVDLTLPLCKTCAKQAGIAVTPPLEAALSIDAAGEVRFRIASSGNHETIAVSEGYSGPTAIQSAVDTLTLLLGGRSRWRWIDGHSPDDIKAPRAGEGE